jgi:hypothetical protein
MKKGMKKLSLNKDTLRISLPHLNRVVGGALTGTCSCPPQGMVAPGGCGYTVSCMGKCQTSIGMECNA